MFVVVVVFNLIFPLFLLLFISYYFKKVSMDPVHESGLWTRSKVGVRGPLVHVLSSPPVITLYAHRNHQLLLARFFSAKLRKHQVTWLPSEVEALAIASAIRHFAPYIVQSPHTTEVLTDSIRRPCVQANEKQRSYI